MRARTVSAGQSGSRLPGTGSRPTVTPHAGRSRTTASMPPPGGVQELDLAAVRLDEPADDREPEARAAVPAASARARSGRTRGPAARASSPGPSRTCSSTHGRRLERRDGDAVPRGAASSAFATRLSSTCASRSGGRARRRAAVDVARRAVTLARPQRGATPSTRSRDAAPPSVDGCSAGGAPASARASASRPSTSGRERSTSASAPSSAGLRRPVASRFSSRSRRAVSGVRSWCDASATNSSCDAQELLELARPSR